MIKRIEHECGFCVVGGGLAGMCAAIAAARSGVKTVIIQDRPVFGGNCSSEIRMHVNGSKGENNRETGIVEEILLESLYKNPDKIYGIWDGILFGKIRSEKNIEYLLNCSVCDADVDGDTIKSVTGWQTTTQQWHTVKADYFADCSGDSILAPLTGAEYRIGREAASEFGEKTSQVTSDKQTMGMSCLIQCRKTDRKSSFVPPDWVHRLTEEEIALRKPNMEAISENFWYLELGGNRDSIGDTEEVRDELVSLAYGMFDYIKNSGNIKDAEYWQLDFLGFLPGKRESRRMVGDLIMTQTHILEGGHFDDIVAYGGWPLDDHHPDGFRHAGNPNIWGKTPAPYGIPYRCMYSVNIRNLYFAGRNISMTHAAMSSARVMATCGVIGEAVGTAAAIAFRDKLTPREVYRFRIDELKQTLMENGCFLPFNKRKIRDEIMQSPLIKEDTENIRNGIDRNNWTYGEAETGVTFQLGENIGYRFESPVRISNIHIAFDSDLDRKTLAGDEYERICSMRANIFPNSPTEYVPKTLVKDYIVEGVDKNGNLINLFSDDCNIRQCVNIKIDSELYGLILRVNSVWDESAEFVHIFSFDAR